MFSEKNQNFEKVPIRFAQEARKFLFIHCVILWVYFYKRSMPNALLVFDFDFIFSLKT